MCTFTPVSNFSYENVSGLFCVHLNQYAILATNICVDSFMYIYLHQTAIWAKNMNVDSVVYIYTSLQF